MKAAGFEYARAKDVSHAVALLQSTDGFAKPLAGGQSLGPMLNLRLARPNCLVDVRHCPELRAYSDEGDSVVYGAGLTHAEFEDGVVPDECGGLLGEVAAGIAYRAVRNRGTIGGSLAHADPAADWLTALLALGAEVILQGPAGRRAIGLRDFVRGPFQTFLEADEVLVGVRLGKRPVTARIGHYKISAKFGEFASAFGAVLDDPERGEARIVMGAIERAPAVIEGEAAREALAVGQGSAEVACVLGRLLDAAVPGLSRAARHLHLVAVARALAIARDAERGPQSV